MSGHCQAWYQVQGRHVSQIHDAPSLALQWWCGVTPQGCSCSHQQPYKNQHVAAGAPFAPQGNALFPPCLQQQSGSVSAAHAGAGARQGSRLCCSPPNSQREGHTLFMNRQGQPSSTGLFVSSWRQGHLSCCLLALPVPACTESQLAASASIRAPLLSAQAAAG